MKINLGYCCISTLHSKIRCNRATTKTYIEKMQAFARHDYLIEKARTNLDDLKHLLRLNVENDILAFRVPEQILPQLDLGYYSADELLHELEDAGRLANELNVQLSTHPSQFFVLNSMRPEVVERSVTTLNLFADFFEKMKLQKTPNITLHIGGKSGYEDKQEAVEGFVAGFSKLSETTKQYLVVENDHVSFDVTDCLKVHQMTGIPVVFDNKHYEWNPGDISYEEAVMEASKTWKNRIMKVHLSSDKDKKIHAHSDYVTVEDYKKLVHALEKTQRDECNIMLECKEKDKAILELRSSLNQ